VRNSKLDDIILGPRRPAASASSSEPASGSNIPVAVDNTSHEPHRDAVAFAVRNARSLIGGCIAVRDGKDAMEEYELAAGVKLGLKAGWARRPPTGKMYGAKYISMYMTDIVNMFQAGVDDQSNKKGPSAMLEELRRRYPGRYSLPSESEITSAISSLLQKQKRGAPLQSTSRGILRAFADDICRLLDQDPSLKPAEGLRRLKLMYTNDAGELPSDFPADGKVKSKISATKSARKKAGMSQ